MSKIVLEERFVVSLNAKLGEGGFAKVYKGLDRKENKQVAIKLYKRSANRAEDEKEIYNHFLRSVDAMKRVSNSAEDDLIDRIIDDLDETEECAPTRRSISLDRVLADKLNCNTDFMDTEAEKREKLRSKLRRLGLSRIFVDLISYSKGADGAPGYDDAHGYFIVTELGDETLQERLLKHVEEGSSMNVNDIRELQWAMVLTVCVLHAVGFVHMDIKPPNIMLFGEMWKLLDFDGVVQTRSKISCNNIILTPLYVAPEVAAGLMQQHHTPSKTSISVSRLMDVWSVGICAMEAIFKQPILSPWYDEWEKETGSEQKFYDWLSDYNKPLMDKDMIEAMDAIDPDMSAMLQGMLTKDPENRAHIADCVTHRWFATESAELFDRFRSSCPTASVVSSAFNSEIDGKDKTCKEKHTGTNSGNLFKYLGSKNKSKNKQLTVPGSSKETSSRACALM